MQRRPVIVALTIAVTACQQLPTDPIARAQAMRDQQAVSTAQNTALTTGAAPDIGGVTIGRARAQRYGGYYGLGYYGPGYFGPGYYGRGYYGPGYFGHGYYGRGFHGHGYHGRGYAGRDFFGYRRCGWGWC
jgi:hypothetical protein